MSPEVNGNGPPPVAKRKKNREKKAAAARLEPCDFNTSYFSNSNLSSHPSLHDSTAYYSVLNPSEPMSLPVYPFAYPNYPYVHLPPTKPVLQHFPLAETNEYMSLPVGTLDQNDNNSKRRFSDPGLPNDSDSSGASVDERIVRKLMQQVQSLRDSNRRLSKELMEMRLELNVLKQQQSSRHFEREYEPGMLADIIREVRDAARVREDALLARVKHMIEEKQLSMSQLHLVAEKSRNNDRIVKLEEQMKNLSMSQSRSEDSPQPSPSSTAVEEPAARQVLELEREALALRRELQEARAKKEESDQRCLQLDKKLSQMMRRSEISSEDGKTTSLDSFSAPSITSSVAQTATPRVTLSGPVTDL